MDIAEKKSTEAACEVAVSLLAEMGFICEQKRSYFQCLNDHYSSRSLLCFIRTEAQARYWYLWALLTLLCLIE